MYINGKWMTEPEIEAHIAKLKKHCKEIQAENAELKQRISELEDKHWDECRQIAHYDDDLRKAKVLLKAAVEGFDNCADKCICDYCDSRCPFYNFGCESSWKYRAEALALIGEDTNVPAREGGERND